MWELKKDIGKSREKKNHKYTDERRRYRDVRVFSLYPSCCLTNTIGLDVKSIRSLIQHGDKLTPCRLITCY
jgi:hypothetical protein